jgi:predicted dehydrogenase
MNHSDPAIEVENGALCIIEFDDGSSHVIDANQNYHEAAKGYECWGSEGRLVINGFDRREDLLKHEIRGIETLESVYSAELHAAGVVTTLPTPPTGKWDEYYRNVAAHILRGVDLSVTPDSVLRMMRLREALLQSARERQVVHTTV